jgi:hypothetical protein
VEGAIVNRNAYPVKIDWLWLNVESAGIFPGKRIAPGDVLLPNEIPAYDSVSFRWTFKEVAVIFRIKEATFDVDALRADPSHNLVTAKIQMMIMTSIHRQISAKVTIRDIRQDNEKPPKRHRHRHSEDSRDRKQPLQPVDQNRDGGNQSLQAVETDSLEEVAGQAMAVGPTSNPDGTLANPGAEAADPTTTA